MTGRTTDMDENLKLHPLFKLLSKYITHVGDTEGVCFLSDRVFSPEELNILEAAIRYGEDQHDTTHHNHKDRP